MPINIQSSTIINFMHRKINILYVFSINQSYRLIPWYRMTYLSISFVCFTFEKLIICSELLRLIHFNFYSSALWLVNVFLLFFGFVNYIFIYVKVLRRLYICIGLRQRPSSGYFLSRHYNVMIYWHCNDEIENLHVKIRYTSCCCFLRPTPASSLQVCLKRQLFYINICCFIIGFT